MFVRCHDCGSDYDDAERWTFCPHEVLMSAEDFQQKDKGIDLLGKFVRFNHQPDGPIYSVQSCGWNGMITLDGLPGDFAPHLFTPESADRNGE